MLKDPKEIEKWLKEMMVTNYTIHESGVVDVDGDVNISNKNLTEIPVQFGEVWGNFNCSENNLTSLEGMPLMVKDVRCDEYLKETTHYKRWATYKKLRA